MMPLLSKPFMMAFGSLYLFQDRFNTSLAAPLPFTMPAEPGPGSWTVTDVPGRMSKSGGKLVTVANATGSGIVSVASFVRVAGLALYANIGATPYNAGGIGWHINNTLQLSYYGKTYGAGGSGAQVIGDSGSYIAQSGPNPGIVILVLRATGAFYLQKSGGVWYLQWISRTTSTSPLYIQWSVSTASYAPSLDDVMVGQLQGIWAAAYDLVTQRIASANAGDTITHETSATIEAAWKATTGATYELMVRRTDDNNCLIIRCDQAGGTIKLIKKDTGSETEDASAAQTWTNNTTYRIVVQLIGNHITVHVNTGNPKIDFASETYNNAVTGAKTSAVVTEFTSWPYALSGAALAEVKRVFDPF